MKTVLHFEGLKANGSVQLVCGLIGALVNEIINISGNTGYTCV